MSLPVTLVLVLLLIGLEARAQPSPALEHRERNVTVTGNPAEPPQEIRAAKGIATVLLFKSEINGGAVSVDKSRVKILAAGAWSFIFELIIDLERNERLVLNVPFADGAQAVFVLVSHGSEVDTRLTVTRREQTVEACQAELAQTQSRCEQLSPVRFARAGGLTPKGVLARPISKCHDMAPAASGLLCTAGTAYRAEGWALVDVRIINAVHQPPWAPREALLKGKSGTVVRGVVEAEPAQLAPGQTGRVLVGLEPPSASEPFVLELRDATGRGLTIPKVNLSVPESKP